MREPSSTCSLNNEEVKSWNVLFATRLRNNLCEWQCYPPHHFRFWWVHSLRDLQSVLYKHWRLLQLLLRGGLPAAARQPLLQGQERWVWVAADAADGLTGWTKWEAETCEDHIVYCGLAPRGTSEKIARLKWKHFSRNYFTYFHSSDAAMCHFNSVEYW